MTYLRDNVPHGTFGQLEGGQIMEVNIFQVDAFSSKPFGGNPAIVIPNAKWINEENMQRIANEMNVSETAFVHQIGDDIFKVRFFTPLCEVDICGHATIATFYTMAEMGYIKPIQDGIKAATLVSNIEKLPIEISYLDGKVESIIMQQAKPVSFGIVNYIKDILSSMNLKEEDIGVLEEYIEPEIISTGLRDLILPIKNKDILDGLKIDFCSLAEACKKLNIIGVHAFYLPELNSDVVFSRNFASIVGINEEAATGTANGALIYYLKKNMLIDSNKITSLQGSSLNRPSMIYCYIEDKDNNYTVKIGGSANIVVQGILKF